MSLASLVVCLVSAPQVSDLEFADPSQIFEASSFSMSSVGLQALQAARQLGLGVLSTAAVFKAQGTCPSEMLLPSKT